MTKQLVFQIGKHCFYIYIISIFMPHLKKQETSFHLLTKQLEEPDLGNLGKLVKFVLRLLPYFFLFR